MGREPKTSRKETTPIQRAQVWTRYCDGHSISAISRLEHLPWSTIKDIITRRELSGDTTFESQPRNQGIRKCSDRDERALLRHANRFPRDTLHALGTPSKSGHKLHRNMVRKILKAHGKSKRKPRRKPYLKPEHKNKRLIWYKQ
jgi:transposase